MSLSNYQSSQGTPRKESAPPPPVSSLLLGDGASDLLQGDATSVFLIP